MKIDHLITELCDYAESCGLISHLDRAYAVGSLMDILALGEYTPAEITGSRPRDLGEYTPAEITGSRPLDQILDGICDWAFDKGLIESDGVVYRDLFDTRIMGALTPRPSEVIGEFERLYATSPEAATDMFYKLACDSNYIRRDRIARDMRWRVDSEYGDIDISINLSKPEKDPKAIAMARLMPQTDFPRCALCHENEGFAGNVSKPARQTLRQIPFEMAGESWYLQYSPYVYYNEHCIALSAEHKPMRIDRSSFEKLLGFVSHFPHYFIGSNADLPIVGGSILSHDHMQGGRYEFAMERADIATCVAFSGFPEVEAGIVRWPMSVIRLRSEVRDALVELADRILVAWRAYSDPEAFIYAETDGTPHNTITPIARMREGKYELDLVLRNNITTEDRPLGVYHPKAERHNIKKENIGLIEVMGLAILPARLKREIELMCTAVAEGRDFSDIPEIRKHADWFASISEEHTVTPYNAEGIIKAEIGRTFVEVLRDAGVYKDTDEGRAAFLKFLATVGGREA